MSSFFLLFAVIIWGWSFVATKICLESLSPVELLGLRVFIALPILFVLARFKGAKLIRNPHVFRQLAIGSTIITAHFLIQITGLQIHVGNQYRLDYLDYTACDRGVIICLPQRANQSVHNHRNSHRHDRNLAAGLSRKFDELRLA